MRQLVKMCRIALEGLRFLWIFRHKKRWWKILPPREYVMWRLGTVYGIYPENDGTKPPKTLKQLLQNLWDDREQVSKYLLSRKQLRKVVSGCSAVW